MYKLILIFKKTDEDNLDFIEHRWSHEFVPLAERMPALQRVSISRVTKSISPEADVHLIHELFFDSLEDLDQAMKSEVGQQAGRLLMEFASQAVQVYFAEHAEDTPTIVEQEGPKTGSSER